MPMSFHRWGSRRSGMRRKRRVGSSARHNGSCRNGANARAWGMSSAVSVTLRPIYERSGCYKRMKDLEAGGGIQNFPCLTLRRRAHELQSDDVHDLYRTNLLGVWLPLRRG